MPGDHPPEVWEERGQEKVEIHLLPKWIAVFIFYNKKQGEFGSRGKEYKRSGRCVCVLQSFIQTLFVFLRRNLKTLTGVSKGYIMLRKEYTGESFQLKSSTLKVRNSLVRTLVDLGTPVEICSKPETDGRCHGLIATD